MTKLPKLKLRNDDIEVQGGLETMEDLTEIKDLLKTSVALTFNTNVMRIALNMQ